MITNTITGNHEMNILPPKIDFVKVLVGNKIFILE